MHIQSSRGPENKIFADLETASANQAHNANKQRQWLKATEKTSLMWSAIGKRKAQIFCLQHDHMLKQVQSALL